MLSSLRRKLNNKTRAWARRRHGISPEPFVLPSRRIYILPTGLGVAFAIMVFAMFLGAMNYGNNLALGLSFLLGALGLVAMHHCQRNLASVRITTAGSDSAFVGDPARFHIALENTAAVPRYAITLRNEYGFAKPARIAAGGRAVFDLHAIADRRGMLKLDQFEISTNYPFGLFRAWSYVHLSASAVIYPKPVSLGRMPPPIETDTGGAQEALAGEEDFAGLRAFHAGDSPRRIAWKAYAREEKLVTKLYAGTAVQSHSFDYDALTGLGVESRLSQLARWIEDAHTEGRAFSLRLPHESIPNNVGAAHRHRCLSALALFPGERT